MAESGEDGVLVERVMARKLPELPGEKMIKEGKTPPEFRPDPARLDGEEVLVVYDEAGGVALAALRLILHDDPDQPLRKMDMEDDLEKVIGGDGLPYKARVYNVDWGALEEVVVNDATDLGIGSKVDYVDSGGESFLD